MEWVTPKQYNTVAKQTTWFKNIPPVVMFKEKRTNFNSKSGTTKNRATMKFEKNIDLARYIYDNRGVVTKIREVVDVYKKELGDLNKKINELSNYNNLGVSLDKIFEGMIKYSQDKNDMEKYVQIIEQLKEKEKYLLDDLKFQSDELKNKINKSYENITGSPYTLFAVWIHSGSSAGSGHFWSYIRDIKLDKWFKFNDISVK